MKISTEIKFGIYLGLALCLYTIFMWLSGLDTTRLAIGQYLDMAVIILPLFFTFLAVCKKSRETELTFFKRILTGLTVNFISFLIYNPFLIIYHHFINPDWLRYVLELKEKELLAQNATPDIIRSALEQAAKSGNDFNHLISGFVAGVLIFGVVFSLLTIPFFRTKKIS